MAYREQRRAGATDHAAWLAAVAALQAVRPIPAKEAGQEATNAIAYASSNHTKWLVGDFVPGRKRGIFITLRRSPQTSVVVK